MRVDLFDFELPPELIAQQPAEPRDSAKLLHIGAKKLHIATAEAYEDLHIEAIMGM